MNAASSGQNPVRWQILTGADGYEREMPVFQGLAESGNQLARSLEVVQDETSLRRF